MLDSTRRRLQEFTGEDETPLDGDTPAWAVSLVIHVAVLVSLAVAGFSTVSSAPKPITVIETVVEEEQEILEIPREVTLDQVVEVDPGSQSIDGLESAESLAQEVSEVSVVAVEMPDLVSDDMKIEPLDVVSAGLNYDENLTVKGSSGVGETGASGAVDRLTLEIAASLEQRSTVVCWVFDQSVSLSGQRKEIAARLERVFDELGLTSTAQANDLFNLVYAYGRQVTPVIDKPTRGVAEVVSAIHKIPVDDSGVENTFTAIAEAAKKAKQIRLSGADRRNAMIIAFTDEVGNDQQYADAVAAFCRSHAMRVFVVGVPAPFGRRQVNMKFVEFDPKYAADEQWAVVEQGPESLYPEFVDVRPKLSPDEPIDSGFGPFSLSKLCAETGGIYFAVHANRGTKGRVSDSATAAMSSQLRYFFDPKVMRDYRPDYLPQAQIDQMLATNKAKASLVEASRAAQLSPMDAPTMRFPREDDGKLALLLGEAQKKAAVLEPKIDSLYGILAAGMPDRAKIAPEEKRWQAGFDLAIGRVLALKVRTNAYNIMLAQAKSGMKFKNPKNDTWILKPSDDVSQVGSQTERLAKQADEVLRRVVADHPGTPWAQMAAEELRNPLGYSWQETYTGVNAPRQGDGNGGNPNPGDDKKRMLAPPQPKRPLKNI
ncbi:MAG: vWA domain-containing protein [Planctomycetota bacterium]